MAIVRHEHKVYVIVSGKGGTGKSTVSVGISNALAQTGLKTLLIDADEGLRCLDLMVGVTDVVYDLSDLLADRCTVEQAAIPVPGNKNLFLISAPYKHGNIDDSLPELVKKLKPDFDRIVVDSTAGVGNGFKQAALCADEAVAVIGCDPVSIRDAHNVCELLDASGIADRRMIINKFDYPAYKKLVLPNIDRVIDDTAIRLCGIVPYDSVLAAGAINGKIAGKGRAYRAFARIAARLEGDNVRLPKLKKI